MKILCIGQAAYDISFLLEEFPIQNTKNKVSTFCECGGGTASNAAYLLGKWGMDVFFAGVVGNDIYGDEIKKEFLSSHVDTTYLETKENVKTTISCILSSKKDKTRTVVTYRNAEKLSPLELAFTPDIILMDGKEYEASIKMIDEYKNAITILDAEHCEEEVIDLCSKVDYIVASKNFAEEISNVKINLDDDSTLKEIYQIISSKFKANLIITLEEKGCLYKEDDIIKIMPTISLNAIDSTGAGDFFHGAFVYGLANNYPLNKVLKIANIAASLSIRYLGTRNSVPDFKEVSEILNEFE